MRIAVLSDTRLPSGPNGHHGLGRSMYDIARGLAQRGHEVTFCAGPGSRFVHGELRIDMHETARADALAARQDFDAYLDGSHQHRLSKQRPAWPVINRLGDYEAGYSPPCAVVATPTMQETHPGARLVRTGIDVAAWPFYANHSGTLLFAGRKEARKGWPGVRGVAEQAGRPFRAIEGLAGLPYQDALGSALALLHPSTEDAGPRTPLEAAACGVPTLCLAVSGTRDHVADGVSGFVCADLDGMAARVDAVADLDRAAVRDWVAAAHGFQAMIDGYMALLDAVLAGERW